MSASICNLSPHETKNKEFLFLMKQTCNFNHLQEKSRSSSESESVSFKSFNEWNSTSFYQSSSYGDCDLVLYALSLTFFFFFSRWFESVVRILFVGVESYYYYYDYNYGNEKCVDVYNVCDNYTQCNDGSDEWVCGDCAANETR